MKTLWYWMPARVHFAKSVTVGTFDGQAWQFGKPVPMVMDDFGQLVQCEGLKL